MPAHIHVVVFHEDKLIAEQGIVHHARDLLENALARLVERVRLAGEDELHGIFCIIDHGRESGHVAQDQIGALISGKAAGKADGEGIRAEHTAQPLQVLGGLAPAACLFSRPGPDKVQQARLQMQVRFPQFRIVHILDAFPYFGFGTVLLPARTQMAIVEPGHLRRNPAWHMHSVGDVANGNFVFGLARMETLPHSARDFPVQG